MAWTTPITAVANAAFSAAQFNASVRDNLLMTAPALATTSGALFSSSGSNSIAQRIPNNTAIFTGETTTSTSYTGTLSGGAGTAGPSLTFTTGQKAFISFHCRQSSSVNTTNVWTSIAVSGATSISGSDNWAISYDQGGQIYHAMAYLEAGLTAGSNTFQMQYRQSGGATGTFGSPRRLNVLPF